MRSTIGHGPVKLIISIIFKEAETLERAEKRLLKLYGPAEPLEIRQPFEWTDYYSEELGSPLKRKIICFRFLHPKEKIFRIKLATNRIEDRFRVSGKRTVNIDPGYVNDAKLVLLTTKDYTHRIHIGGSIFAESTLFFREGSFGSWPWTYPDYASGELINYFNDVRKIYMENDKKKWKIKK